MLKLGKLPDRMPVKITITLAPELNGALSDYAAVYREAYGEAVSVADLVPFMLEAFLQSDKAFAKARKVGLPQADTRMPLRQRRQPRSVESVRPSFPTPEA
ncbi:MAG: DUF2274 domain-containing protein [Methylocystaceae bacterium]|nr:MAG: DUF2274 domain-containing protein [Methylocystaceae bacterium]